VECETKSDTGNNRNTRTISKSLKQYLSNIPGKHEIKVLQKNSHIVHSTQNVENADVKVQKYFTGEIKLYVAQTVNTEQLQHCVPYKHSLFQVYNCKYRAKK
jgi:hypothetical protein